MAACFSFAQIACVTIGVGLDCLCHRRRRLVIQATLATTAPHGEVALGQGKLYLQPIQPNSHVNPSQYQPQQVTIPVCIIFDSER